MSTLVVRWVFAALCGVFFFSIGGVAVWEWIRFRRGESALSPRHFRWRMLSALTWLIVLGSFFVATTFLWPQSPTGQTLTGNSPAEAALLKRAALVYAGSMALMLFAFALMAVDVFWTVQVGRRGVQERARRRQQAIQRQIGVTQREPSDPASSPNQEVPPSEPNTDRNGHYSG